MIKFLTVDIFVILGSLSGVAMFLSRWKERRRKRSMIRANFIGGPLDGKTKMIYPSKTYRDISSVPNAIYELDEFNIYVFKRWGGQ